jgi:galactose mutarotase-like enzyme
VLITLSNKSLEAQISEAGAELVRLRDEARRDLLWDGNPAFWTGRSPLLFPIVGRLKDDRVRIDHTEYSLKQHGFARTSPFEIIDAGPTACLLRLISSNSTLQHYPFNFDLKIGYSIEEFALTIEAAVLNSGQGAMPVSFGFHPAFRWPLPYGGDRNVHEIRFEQLEPNPIRLLHDGLLGGSAGWTPVDGNQLLLRDELFEDGALVFDRITSRAVEYGVPGQRLIKAAFPEMPHLGIWTKPGAGFICIEPWQGYASPIEFDGELADKPGIVCVGPGEVRRFSMVISITEPHTS